MWTFSHCSSHPHSTEYLAPGWGGAKSSHLISIFFSSFFSMCVFADSLAVVLKVACEDHERAVDRLSVAKFRSRQIAERRCPHASPTPAPPFPFPSLSFCSSSVSVPSSFFSLVRSGFLFVLIPFWRPVGWRRGGHQYGDPPPL